MTFVLDDIAPAFRAARERWPNAPNLQQHYEDLARTFKENGSSLIELTKSFLEMVCHSELLYYLDRQAYVSVLHVLRGIEPGGAGGSGKGGRASNHAGDRSPARRGGRAGSTRRRHSAACCRSATADRMTRADLQMKRLSAAMDSLPGDEGTHPGKAKERV